MSKAPVAVAIIAKDSAKTIGPCLDSLVPFVQQVVVCVDERTTDNTARVAKQHGAKVYHGLKVSDWHECPEHGKVLAQDFAKARQISFAKLPNAEWHMWVDADDVVRGADKLEDYLAKLAPDVAGVWLPYHYSSVGEGPDKKTSTLFDRERIVRSSMPWQWQYRVHEILTPIGVQTEHLNWARTQDIAIWHQGKGHDTAGSAKRNILLLEIDLEEKPNDMRTLFYLGNQYFALGEWQTAAYWYERSTVAQNPYQVWQAYIYLSMAYEKMGNMDAATNAAHGAIEVAPYHPEPYYRLAQMAMLRQDLQRCEFWTHFADKLPDAPAFAFRNPLDRTFNARVTLGNAYFNAGHVSKAKYEFERANSVVPTAELQKGIAEFSALEQDSLMADSWVRVLQASNGNVLQMANTLGTANNIWKFGRVRDIIVPEIIKARPNTQPRIVFWCGQGVEPWAPPSVNTTGIGGSETAVIEIAKRFARDGWRVDVYNNPDKFEGLYEEVGYWDCSRLTSGERADILVGWRNAAVAELPLERKLSVLWCHDLNRGPDARAQMAAWGLVLGVSQWHADYLSYVYGHPNTKYVPNGIDLERFSGHTTKVPFRCVYASSPDRGLERLLDLWPRIVENEPAAELHVAYGWETIDKYIQMGHQTLVPFKAHMQELIERTPRVVWRGRLPQDELAKLYQESYALLYPSDFLEVSCITAMEAMAGGCVPVTSSVGALPETISDGGAVVTGNVYTRAWRDYYTHIVKGVLHSPDIRRHYAAKGLERAQGLTWDKAYEKWKEAVVTGLELQAMKENWAQMAGAVTA